MRTSTTLGIAAVGGALLYQVLPREQRARATSALRHYLADHMESIMEKMPEDAPPRLVRDLLPKLEAQNGEIIALLQEQNALLENQRERMPEPA